MQYRNSNLVSVSTKMRIHFFSYRSICHINSIFANFFQRLEYYLIPCLTRHGYYGRWENIQLAPPYWLILANFYIMQDIIGQKNFIFKRVATCNTCKNNLSFLLVAREFSILVISFLEIGNHNRISILSSITIVYP